MLGGIGGNVMTGDRCVTYGPVVSARDDDDALLGGQGGDELIGRGGNDLIMAGGNNVPGNIFGADLGAIIVPSGDTLYGDHEAVHNAEILARVLTQVGGADSDTCNVDSALLVKYFGPTPLRLDIGTSAQISLVNPLTGYLPMANALQSKTLLKVRELTTPALISRWLQHWPVDLRCYLTG